AGVAVQRGLARPACAPGVAGRDRRPGFDDLSRHLRAAARRAQAGGRVRRHHRSPGRGAPGRCRPELADPRLE
ncbi:MAG: hypothetical protein AVDCRST_MAG59-3732, partial [uncultured Thermomicrobiales bacterium]